MLKVLSINKFIKNNGILEVTSRISFDKEGNPLASGLYSNVIFGDTSKEMAETFGYINLSVNVIHPSILDSLNKISTLFKKVIQGEKSVVIKDGLLVEDIKGSSGLGWLFNSWNKIDINKFKTTKNSKIVSYISELKRDEIFINKYLVVPPKFRMYVEENGITKEDELTMLYKELLTVTTVTQDSGFMGAILKSSSRELVVNNAIQKLYQYFLMKLEKKDGAFRSNLVSKRIDNNVRLVANARPDVPFNCAGLPWHVLLNIFDVYIVGMLHNNGAFSKDFANLLGTSSFSPTKYGTHFDYIYRNVDTYTDANKGKRELWIELLKELFEYHSELKVLLKRDPAWDKNSYHTLSPIIIPTNSYHVVVNSLLYKPLGGDSFSTNFTSVKDFGSIISDDNGKIYTDDNNFYKIRSLESIFDKEI